MRAAGTPERPAAAALALAARLGLPAERAVLLHAGSNAVVHLAPTPVVARVARLTARARPHPDRALAREVDLARWLAAAGAAVLPPTGVVDPGPHVVDGWHASLWPHLDLGAGAHATGVPEVVAAALADLHQVAAGYPGDLPGLGEVVEDAARALAAAGDWLPAPARERLEQALARASSTCVAVDAAGDRRPLHGDAHPRNLLRAGGGVLWCDLEDAVSAPVEWDVAVMGRSARHDGAAAVRAYAAVTGRALDADLLEALGRVRDAQGACWQVLFADDDAARRPGVLELLGAPGDRRAR